MQKEHAALARQFDRFATLDVLSEVPLYRELARIVAAEPDLLALAAATARGQPPPNLLFAAVRFQLNRTPDDPLWQTYRTPDVPGNTLADQFREFCRKHAHALTATLRTRKVQTNEVGRSSLLLAAYLNILEHTDGVPFHLVEIGTSAGLNLIFDRCFIEFTGWRSYGPSDSPVRLRAELRGDRRPPDRPDEPIISSRIGIDLSPLDCRHQDDRDWLAALVWPGQEQRLERLRAACLLAAEAGLDLRSGDAVSLLPKVLSELPPGEPVVVSHSWVLNQFSDESRKELQAVLNEASRHRPVFKVGVEWAADAESALELTTFCRGPHRRRLGTCHPHGHWLQWTA